MKKTIALILAALLAMASVGACAAPANEGSTGSGTKSEGAAGTEAKQNDFVTLKYFNIGDKAKGMDLMVAEMNKILKEELNCEFVQEYIPWEDIENKYQLVFASGEDFDGIYTASWCSYGAVAAKNGYMELTPEFIETNAPFVAKAVPEEGWNQTKVNGKIYMLPHTTREFNHYVVATRGDLQKKYNLPKVDSYEALGKYLEAVKANEPDLTPISFGQTGEISNWMVLWNLMQNRFSVGEMFVQMFYVKNDDPKAKVVNFLEQPDCKEFLTMMSGWQKAGYWSRSALSGTERSVDDFSNGIAAACVGNMGTADGTYAKDVNTNDGAWNVTLNDLTASANKKVPTYPYNSGGVALNRNAKNPERFAQMINLFRENKDYNRLVQCGIQGMHWDYEEDGTTIEYLKTDPDKAYGDALTWGPFRNVEFTQFYSKTNSPGYKDMFENAATRELTIPATAFLFNDSNVKNEIAAVSDVYAQYVLPLILGFTEPAELDSVIGKLKDAGVDKVIAEMQAQMDANLADSAK